MFKELFTEAIKPTEIPYGDNYPEFDNKKKLKFNSADARVFAYDDKVYGVFIAEEGDMSFGVLNWDESKSTRDNLKTIKNDRSKTKNPLKVFNHVFYIITQMLKTNKLKYLSFAGSDDGLSKLYDKIVKNKKFLSTLSKFNLEYDGYEDGLHWFKKD